MGDGRVIWWVRGQQLEMVALAWVSVKNATADKSEIKFG